MCPYLDILGAIKQQPISYLAGSQVTITGCRSDMVLDGAKVYTCAVEAGQAPHWEPEMSTVCKGVDFVEILA